VRKRIERLSAARPADRCIGQGGRNRRPVGGAHGDSCEDRCDEDRCDEDRDDEDRCDEDHDDEDRERQCAFARS
jgi:hypothetical protein